MSRSPAGSSRSARHHGHSPSRITNRAAPRGQAAVLAVASVVDGIGSEPETIAVERPIHDGGHPPARDHVLAQLEEAGRHQDSEPAADSPAREGKAPVRLAPRTRPKARANAVAAWATSSMLAPRSRQPASEAIDVETTPGIPHASMRLK